VFGDTLGPKDRSQSGSSRASEPKPPSCRTRAALPEAARPPTEHDDRLFSERFYGRFERRIPVEEVEEDKVSASFKNGVLTVTLPRSAKAQQNVNGPQSTASYRDAMREPPRSRFCSGAASRDRVFRRTIACALIASGRVAAE
jgi:hypothetical protein